MPSTYTNILRLELQADGENDGTWGQILNDNVIALIEDAVAGTASISTTGGTTTLSTNDGADDQARRKVLDVSGSLGSDAIIEVPAQSKTYVVRNRTSGSQTVEVLVAGQSAGNGVVVPQGETQSLYCDGSDVEPAAPAIPRGNEAALFDSDLAANGGSIPETDRGNTFTQPQTIENRLVVNEDFQQIRITSPQLSDTNDFVRQMVRFVFDTTTMMGVVFQTLCLRYLPTVNCLKTAPA
jgi:hypothetical protein